MFVIPTATSFASAKGPNKADLFRARSTFVTILKVHLRYLRHLFACPFNIAIAFPFASGRVVNKVVLTANDLPVSEFI